MGVDDQSGEVTGDQCLAALRETACEHARFYLYTMDTDAFPQVSRDGLRRRAHAQGKPSVRTQFDVIAHSLPRGSGGHDPRET